MYIQENAAEPLRTAPPDYSGHTYAAEPPAPLGEKSEEVSVAKTSEEGAEQMQKSTPAGAFSGKDGMRGAQKDGKRGDFFGGLGWSGLFSRIPFLSALAPPPRSCGEGERKHSEFWDFALLAVVALSLLNGKDDDVLPLLLLLLLWD